jgi:hypothetical protein
MSRLLQFLIRAYLPLVARHTLIDGPAHAAGKPSIPAPVDSAPKPARIGAGPRRQMRRDDSTQVSTLAA